MTTRHYLPALALIIASCSPSDPMQSTYHKEDRFAALYDENGERKIDSLSMTYIVQGEVENEVQGVDSEGKTYQSLYEVGKALAVKKRASEMYDSTMYRIESKRRQQGLPPLP